MSDASRLGFHLANAEVGQYTNILLQNGYTLSNVELLEIKDLDKLRITNKKDQQRLLSVAARLREAKSVAATSQTKSPRKPTTVVQPTAAECCRSAANFLAHKREDRLWPKNQSSLALNIGLSSAVPKAPNSEVYSVIMDEFAPVEALVKETKRTNIQPIDFSWKVVNQRNPEVPCSNLPFLQPGLGVDKTVTAVVATYGHIHGKQSSRCEICEQHVKENTACFSGGQWQYQASETIQIGAEMTDHVFVWKPFAPVESLMIENAWRKRLSIVKIDGHIVDLDTLMWRGMHVRRNGDFSVGFPSLSKKEISSAPQVAQERVEQLENCFAAAYLSLVDAAEDQMRSGVRVQEASELLELRAQIAADVSESFARERLDLELQETITRRKIEDDDLDASIDRLWDAAAKGVQDAILAMNTREAIAKAHAICVQQYQILESLESIDRTSVAGAEEAEWSNYCKLIARFNAQVRALLSGANDKITLVEGIRCSICHSQECKFFKLKWKGHWRHHGKVDGIQAKSVPNTSVPHSTMSALMATVQESEYVDFLKARPASATSRVAPPSPRLYPGPAAADAPRRQGLSPQPPPFRFGRTESSPHALTKAQISKSLQSPR